jgi:outer membrane lipoprotein SlyB
MSSRGTAAVLMNSALLLIFFLCAGAGLLAATAPDIPAGTEIQVRVIENLNSGTARLGDIFHGTLDEPIVVSGKQLFPKGADVTGTISGVHASGRLSDPGELTLVLNTISSGGMASSVTVQPLQIKGESHTKSNATKAGGGAVLGAIIGGIAGGGKGAAIGAGAGAAAGTGAAAATGKKEASLKSESVITFVSTSGPAPNVAPIDESKPVASERPAEPNPAAQPTPPVEPNPPAKAGGTPRTSFDNAVLFTARDRRVIRNCLNERAADLPTGTLQREELPSGSERQVKVGGMLPSDLQRKAQPLPLACEDQLPRLPGDQERVVYSGRVLLIDAASHILDMFDLSANN